MTHHLLRKVSSGSSDPLAAPDDGRGMRWDWEKARRTCLLQARSILKSPAAAEDAAQEALIRAWRSAPTPAALDRPSAWIARIARNEALRVLAREGRRREVPAGGEPVSAASGVVAEAENTLRRAALVRAVSGLSARERQLFALRYLRDLTQAEIAELLGIPEGTVKVGLHRLRKRLQERLGGTDGEAQWHPR
jgi:RNA polymerase sigma-70 factor (ECF subfamily)